MSTPTDFNLVRAPPRRTILPMDRLVEFTTTLIGITDPEDWNHERVIQTTWPHDLLTCATCLSKGCLIVFKAFLVMQNDPMSIAFEEDEDDPPASVMWTEMRLWQMTVDCWLAAGGTPDTLRWVAFHHIINDDVVNAMNEECYLQQAQPGQTIIMTSRGARWYSNAFTRRSSNVANALYYLDPDRKVIEVRAHLLFPPPERNGMRIIAELRREGESWAAPFI